MPKTLPAGLLTELQKRCSPQIRTHVIDIELADGTRHFWASREINCLSKLTGAAQQYKPWLVSPYPEFTQTRSIRADYGEFNVQNLSGNTIDREVAALVKAGEFEGATCVYREWFTPLDVVGDEFHGQITDVQVSAERVKFGLLQLLRPSTISAFDSYQTRGCHHRFGSARCGYRRGTLFVPLTRADVHTASSIGKSGGGGLGTEPNRFKSEVIWLLFGTGALQERYIASHTADVFTPTVNFSPAPDNTTDFLITGPGAMLVGATVADIFSAATIGKTGAGWTVNAWAGQTVALIAGVGAPQMRKIASNTADTITPTVPWTTAPNGTTVFIVIFADCPKDRASCNTRGMIERFAGIIHLQAQITQIATPIGVPIGGGGGGGGRDDGDGLGGSIYARLA